MRAEVERRLGEGRLVWKVDGKAAFRDEELRGRDVHASRRFQRAHRIHAARGEMAERERERAHDPGAGREPDHVSHLAGDRVRARCLEGEDLHVFLRPGTGQGPVVEEGSFAATRYPFLARAVIEDVAEEDIRHRGPVGDGERDREEGDPPLGVHAAVDRVEHEAWRTSAEGALAELLGDQRELDAGCVELLQPRDRGPLGRGVDRRRLVAAFARADDELPLEPRRELGERGADVLRDEPGEREPVRHSSKGEKTSPLVSLGKK